MAPQSFWKVADHIVFGRNGAWPKERLKAERRLDLHARLGTHDLAVTFVNHATVFIQMAGINVLTDPVWSERVGPWSWAGPRRAREPGIPFGDLPNIDVVLISHNHYDHLDLPTLKRLEETHAPLFVVPLGDRGLLERAGMGRVVELDWWETLALPNRGEVIFTPAQHNSGRWPWSQNQSLWGSFLIRRDQRSIYFAGDTAYGAHFREVRRRFGRIDLALLPIGAYEPREMMAPYHMSPAEAVVAQHDLEAHVTVGIHYGTFQLTNEDFDAPAQDLNAALEHTTNSPGPFLALAPGHTRVMDSNRRLRPSTGDRIDHDFVPPSPSSEARGPSSQ